MKIFKSIIFVFIFITNAYSVQCGDEDSMGNYAIDIAKQKNSKVKKSNNVTYKGFNTAYGYAFMVYYQNNNKSKNAWMTLITLDKNCNIISADGKSSKSTFEFTK